MNSKEIKTYNIARFIRYQKGVAYYAIAVPYSKQLYSFPVPIDNLDDDMLLAENNTINFVEHISDAIQNGTLIKEAA